MAVIQALRERLNPERPKPLPPGLYNFTAPPSDPLNYRLHLRIEPGGEGVLIVNASTVLHLNRTAAEYAYHLVNLTPQAQVAQQVAKRFRVKPARAGADYAEFRDHVLALIETPDLDPVTYLDFDRHTPYTEALSAPYRLDCALTYKLPKGAPPEAAPHKNVDRELTAEEWKTIIDKAWEVGIPQLIFTGGEPTLREDLPELLQVAEDHGMVTGLITDGLKLGDTKYLKQLLDAGLDYAMIVLQPGKKQTWESLASFAYWKEVLADDIFIAAHLTLTPDNVKEANGLLDRLAESGVTAVSLSASNPKLAPALEAARDHTDMLNLPLVWDLPVPYSAVNPVNLELDAATGSHPEGAGKAWLYVEPDGDVLPTQGAKKKLGNMLKDDWGRIWKHE